MTTSRYYKEGYQILDEDSDFVTYQHLQSGLKVKAPKISIVNSNDDKEFQAHQSQHQHQHEQQQQPKKRMSPREYNEMVASQIHQDFLRRKHEIAQMAFRRKQEDIESRSFIDKSGNKVVMPEPNYKHKAAHEMIRESVERDDKY